MAEGETRKGFPMLPISHWWALRKKFRQSIPGVVTDSYLSTVLSMGVNSARANVLPFLKVLGIIDQDGKPTERAKLWRDDAHYTAVCKAIVSEVYPAELRDAVPDPASEKAKARSWFAQHTGVGEEAANRMVSLYSLLVEADSSKQPDLDKKPTPKKATPKSARAGGASERSSQSANDAPRHPPGGEGGDSGSGDARRGSPDHSPEVNINLQIHISADASPDQIDQIFASMAKHLYKRG